MPTLYSGAQVATEDAAPSEADVLVGDDGVISEVGPGLVAPEGAETIGCSGKLIMPGMFDPHIHAREPGQTGKETIKTCAAAAVNGGVTGIVLMPNTVPAIDSAGQVQAVLDIAKRDAEIPVFTSGCITKDRAGEELAGIAGMKEAGVLMLTDDGSPVPNPLVLRRAMEYARDLDLFLASHCETMELSGKGAMNEEPTSYALGIPGIPAISEELCLDRDIRIAGYTGAHVHIQHVTTAIGMETIRRGKEDGIRVTGEVSPHHLIFCDEDIGDYDTQMKMNPPLRTREDNERLLQGLIDGVFDFIATDHAPHTEFEKNMDFASAPFGITGLESAVVSLYHHFIKPGRFGWDLLVKRYSAEPRRLMRLDPVEIKAGQDANFLVFDPAGTTTFTRDFMQSKSINTPFLDKELDGSIDLVVLGEKTLLDRSAGGAS